MEKVLHDLAALQAEAASFVQTLSPADGHATLITLSGELGAGKTSFTQGLARALGVAETVTSPTFVLEKIYDLPENSAHDFARLVHIDAYRLEGEKALMPLDFDTLYADAKNLMVLEWPEQVADGLPKEVIRISFEVLPDNTRKIIYA